MGWPPVRGDNPQALTSGLSYVHVDKHGITVFSTFISEDLAHHDIFRAKVDKGGINRGNLLGNEYLYAFTAGIRPQLFPLTG